MSMIEETTHIPNLNAYRSSLIVMSTIMAVLTLGIMTIIFLANQINVYSILISIVLSMVTAAYIIAEKREMERVDQRIATLNN